MKYCTAALLMLCVAFNSVANAEPEADNARGNRVDTPAATGFADVDAYLATLFKNYSAALTAIDRGHSSSVTGLKANYDSTLERQMNFYQDGGSPAGALAVRQERQRIKAGQPVPEGGAVDGSGDLKILSEHQSRYLQATGSLEKTRDGKVDSANTKLREALEQYQSQLTRDGSLDRVEVVATILASVPTKFANATIDTHRSPPTSPQELADYLEGTSWTWMGGKPAHAKFLPGQEYETSSDSTGRVFGRWPYTITDDLELTSPFKNKTFRFKFDRKFLKLEVFEEPGGAKIRDGKLKGRDTEDSK